MADLNTIKISPETWSLMKQEERDEAEAGALLFPDEPELWCQSCELGLNGCGHSATPVYFNPIVCVVPYLMEKLSGVTDVVRAIGEFSSGTTERDEAARTIQSWWEGLLAREREEYDDYYDDYEPWRYGCVGPYSENYSRCFGPCCN